jgi:hypothetical protein
MSAESPAPSPRPRRDRPRNAPKNTGASAGSWAEAQVRLEQLLGAVHKSGLNDARRQAIDELLRDFPKRKGFITGKLERAMVSFERANETRRRQRSGQALSRVKRTGDRRVSSQPPCATWTLLLDETGSDFALDRTSTRHEHIGRFVALAIPSTATLAPRTEAWHAVEATLDEIDQLVQTVLDAPIGIFGMRMHDVPYVTHGDRWISGIAECVQWLLRLLPLPTDAEQTRVEVVVEQRWPPYVDNYDITDFLEEIRRGLARSWPERFARMSIRGRVVAKDAHPLNAYVDAVAFTWGSPAAASSDRRVRSGLMGTCLLDHIPTELAAAWDAMRTDMQLDSSVWRRLIGLRYHQEPGSIAAGLFEQLGEYCRTHPDAWNEYLEQVEAHMESKLLSMDAFRAQMDWLAEYMPDSVEFSPYTELRWLTARLAVMTHLGHEFDAVTEQINELANALFEEYPTQVCELQLRRAVGLTNVFRFADARASLQSWTTHPVAVPGLRHWGRVMSSLGQHAAFEGDNVQAAAWFRKAISGFERLSHPADRAAEIAHTRAYLCIVLMDDTTVSDQVVRRQLLEHLGTDDLPALFARWASMVGDGQRLPVWHMYVALRWLLQRGTRADKAAWVEANVDMATQPAAHPWPLVRFYHGLLLRRTHRALAESTLETAISDAVDPDNGPVLHLMGVMMAQVSLRVGLMKRHRHMPLLDRLRSQIPHATPWMDAIQQLPAMPRATDEEIAAVLSRCLPFNFR